MTIDDVLGAELATGRPVPTAVEGEPYERWHVISDDGRVELGIWDVTPGSFRGSCDGYYEQMHFVAGSGTITDADGKGNVTATVAGTPATLQAILDKPRAYYVNLHTTVPAHPDGALRQQMRNPVKG